MPCGDARQRIDLKNGEIVDVGDIADGEMVVRDGDELVGQAVPGGGVSDGDKGDIVVSAGGTVWDIDARAVGSAEMAAIATDRLLGRITAAAGDVEVLTGAQANTILPAFTGDSGAGGVKGSVPAPGAGDGAAKYSLLASGSFGIPRGTYKAYVGYSGNVSGTYTPSAGVTSFRVRVTGAGAGGGGADSTGAAAGGGAGGYSEKWYAGPSLSTYAYQGRAGGTGGAAGNTAGNAPVGATTFDTLSVPASNGGAGSGTGGTSTSVVAGGAPSAVPTGGDINIKGGGGGNGLRFSAAGQVAGQGAASALGSGGRGGLVGADGEDAAVPGAGGGGAAAVGGTDRAGGAGGDSLILVEEFY